MVLVGSAEERMIALATRKKTATIPASRNYVFRGGRQTLQQR